MEIDFSVSFTKDLFNNFNYQYLPAVKFVTVLMTF